MNIGGKLKLLRTQNKMTLKALAEQTGISIGFLSQFERGLTTIDVTHLATIAAIFNVSIQYFFDDDANEAQVIMRGYEPKITKKFNKAIYKTLSPDSSELAMEPELIELLPRENKELPEPYTHEGEEFIYVLSGVLTLVINDQTFKMYPTDATHFSSQRLHNWGNQTDEIVRLIVVHTGAGQETHHPEIG
ncbi:helix-turn-helix domain-containing protein [Lapidilactobacillus salsurivasis]